MHPKEEQKRASATKKDLSMQILDRPPQSQTLSSHKSKDSIVNDEFKDFFKIRKDENDKSVT